MSEQSSAPAAAPSGESSAPVADSSQSTTTSENSQAQSAPSAADIQDAVESGQISEAQAQKMIKKFKLKVDGKEFDHEIDLSDENAVRNELQLAAAAKKRMAETADIKKQYLKEMERLKNDPFSVLSELGLDPEELSAGFIQKKIEEMKKSPEQLAAEKMQKEMEELRTKLKQKEEAEKNAEMEKLNQQAVQSLNEEIDKAISGHKKLPNTPLVRKRFADQILWAMNNGFPDATAEDVAPMVEKELRQELGGLFEGLEDDAFEDWVGKERLAKARKKKSAPVAPTKVVPGLSNVKPTTASVKAEHTQKEEPKKMKAKDFFRGR